MVTIVLIAWNADAEHRQVIIVKNALAKNETRKAVISWLSRRNIVNNIDGSRYIEIFENVKLDKNIKTVETVQNIEIDGYIQICVYF